MATANLSLKLGTRLYDWQSIVHDFSGTPAEGMHRTPHDNQAAPCRPEAGAAPLGIPAPQSRLFQFDWDS